MDKGLQAWKMLRERVSIKRLKRKLGIRLGVSGLLLSLLFGVTTFFLETESIDQEVVHLAYKVTDRQMSGAIDIQDPAKLQKLLVEKSQELVNNNFIVIELYNAQKEKMKEIVKPEKEIVEKVLKQYDHQFPMSDQATYRKFYINQTLYLQVLVPLMADGSRIVGYFEGVYQVDQNQMQQINQRIQFTVIQTIIVVLATTLLLIPVILALNKDLIQYSLRLIKANTDLLEVLGGVISKKDTDTYTHNYRVTIYAVRLAEKMRLNKEEIKRLIKGALIHDVGKIAIRDEILLKPGKLTDEEFAVMKTHVIHGVDIIKNSEWLLDGRDVVEYHHEKFDGSGYMQGLKGEDIPLNARIFAIVDVFDALTSKRPYKEPYSYKEAVQILLQGKGSHFDPVLLESFLEVSKQLYHQLSHAKEQDVEQILSDLVKKYYYDQL